MKAGGRRALLFSLGSPVLLTAAQSPIALWPLGVVALVPWLSATRSVSRAGSLVLGALVGSLYGVLSAPWLPEALRGLGASPLASFGGFLVTAAWAKAPIFAAAGWAFHATIGTRAGFQIAGVAFVMGIGELLALRAPLGVPFALLGHSQLPSLGVSQLALVGGVPLISALLVSINAALVLSYGTSPAPARRIALATLIAWLVTAVAGLPLARWMRPLPSGDAPRHKLLIAQPNLPRGERWIEPLQLLNLKRLTQYTERGLRNLEEPREITVVWPENALTFAGDATSELIRSLERWVDRSGVQLITGFARGAHDDREDRYRSSVLWLAPTHGIVAEMDKGLAVPVIERALGGNGALLGSLFGGAGRGPKVEESRILEPLRGDFTVAVALCYEALFSSVAAKRRDEKTSVILQLADDSWVGGEWATRQLTDFSSFRAIEQRLPLVRVAHGGLSVVVDEFGVRVTSLPLDEYAQELTTLVALPPPIIAERATMAGLPIVAGVLAWWLTGVAAGWVPPRRRSSKDARAERGLAFTKRLLRMYYGD